MGHKQLTKEQRYHIYGLWKAGYNQVEMAKAIGVHKSTISREFKRNTRWNTFQAKHSGFVTTDAAQPEHITNLMTKLKNLLKKKSK